MIIIFRLIIHFLCYFIQMLPSYAFRRMIILVGHPPVIVRPLPPPFPLIALGAMISAERLGGNQQIVAFCARNCVPTYYTSMWKTRPSFVGISGNLRVSKFYEILLLPPPSPSPPFYYLLYTGISFEVAARIARDDSEQAIDYGKERKGRIIPRSSSSITMTSSMPINRAFTAAPPQAKRKIYIYVGCVSPLLPRRTT